MGILAQHEVVIEVSGQRLVSSRLQGLVHLGHDLLGQLAQFGGERVEGELRPLGALVRADRVLAQALHAGLVRRRAQEQQNATNLQ